MKKILFLFAAAFVALGSCKDANALLVTRGTDTLNSAFAGVTVNSDADIDATGQIRISVDALKAGTLGKIGFIANGTGQFAGTGGFGARAYEVIVTMKNMVTPANMSLGFAMNGFDVTTTQPGAANLFANVSSAVFSSDKFGTVLPNVLTPNTLRFGGLVGGGGEIYSGETAISRFTLGITSLNNSSPSAFSLDFTANPEPATLLLGSLAMIPAGVALRRRRKAQQGVVEAV